MKLRSENTHYLTTRSGKRYTRSSKNKMKKIDKPEEKYEKQEYYDHPERFKCIFQEEYLPYLSLFVNGIYWDHRYPRMIKKKELAEYYR